MPVDVVGIDDFPVVDFLMQTDRIPGTNEMADLHGYSWQGGGKVSTAIAALGRLGAKAGIAGIVGGDAFGRFCIEDFKRHGVDTSRMIVEPDKTTTLSVCIAERETKGRSFLGKWGTCRRLEVGDLDREYITSARYVHLWQMTPATVRAAEWAREGGARVVFDADVYDGEIEKNLGLIDVFIASEFFYKSMFHDECYEENCRRLREKGPGVVVITLGDKGSLGLEADTFFEMPAFTGVEIVDTTGAGDVYHGAFIYGLLQGWSAVETARFANAVAAIKCTRPGGRAGIPDAATAERFLRDGHIDYTEIDKRVEFYKNGLFA